MAGLQNPDLSFEQLYQEAERSMPLLQEQGDRIVSDLQKRHPGLFDDVKFELGPLKSVERAQAKINGDYKIEGEDQGDHTKIVDLARGRFVIDKPEQVEALREYFKEQREGFKVEVTKDRFEKPSDTNFRDINMQVRLGNGHVVEVRVEQRDILEAAKRTHDPYEEIQEIDRKAAQEGRMLTQEEATQRQRILDSIRDIHGEPATRTGMDRLLSEKGKEKVASFESERVQRQPAANDPDFRERVPHPETRGRSIGRAGGIIGLSLGIGVAASDTARREGRSATMDDYAGAALEQTVIAPLADGRRMEATMRALEMLDPSSGVASSGLRSAFRSAGADVDPGMLEGLRRIPPEERRELRRNIGVIAYDNREQFGVLQNAGLTELRDSNGQRVDVAAVLRDPARREAFMQVLERAQATEQNPAEKEKIRDMVDASHTFLGIEARRGPLAARNDEILGRAEASRQPTAALHVAMASPGNNRDMSRLQ